MRTSSESGGIWSTPHFFKGRFEGSGLFLELWLELHNRLRLQLGGWECIMSMSVEVQTHV